MRPPALLLFLVLLLPSTGCESASRSVGRSEADQRIATLNGFRLGMLLPDAYQVADSLKLQLKCDAAETGDDVTSWCRSRNAARTTNTGFEAYQGSIALIASELGEDWATVPRDTLIARLTRELGRPEQPRSRTAEGRFRLEGVWKASNGQDFRALFCVNDSAKGCGEQAVRVTPAYLVHNVVWNTKGRWGTIEAIECTTYIPTAYSEPGICSKKGIAPQLAKFSETFPKISKTAVVGMSEIPQNYYDRTFEQLEAMMEPLGSLISSEAERSSSQKVRVSARFDPRSNLIHALVDREGTPLIFTIRYDPAAFYPDYLDASVLSR